MLQDNSLENKDHGSRSKPPSSGLPQPVRVVLIGIVLTSGAGLIVALIGLYVIHNTTTALIGGGMILGSGTTWCLGAIMVGLSWLRQK